MNIPDYENYERLDSFTPERLKAYRAMLLEKTKPQIDFISRRVWDGPLNVVEFGSGNGRLLVGLHKAGLLKFGVGIDASKSRTEFARAWAREVDLERSRLSFETRDIMSIGGRIGYDLAVCITGCFQYMYAIAPEAPAHLLRLMRGSKYALFELYRKPQMGRTWRKLPNEDPWNYLLDEYEDVGDWVRHTKTFIGHRDAENAIAEYREDIRTENLAYYEMPVFLRHLQHAGFNNMHWAKQNSTTMVVLVS